MWSLANEFDHMPLMPAPLNIPENVWIIGQHLIQRLVDNYSCYQRRRQRRSSDDSSLNIEKIKNSQSNSAPPCTGVCRNAADHTASRKLANL
jgi:hypothetical protein